MPKCDAKLDEVWEVLGPVASVDWVEPVYRLTAFGIPNDELYSFQWNLPMKTSFRASNESFH